MEMKNNLPTIGQILNTYPEKIRPIFGSTQKDIELILQQVLKKDQSFVLANLNKPLTRLQFFKFKKYFQKREKEIPLQYIFGSAFFYGNHYKVNHNVLIPRPETELLVDISKEYVETHPIRNIVEIGCGSGAVIITLAKLLSQSKKAYNYIATDISTKALLISRYNGIKNKVFVNFRKRNFIKKPNTFIPLTSWILVSNPPYVKSKELLEPSIAHEPILALDGGDDGLSAYSEILENVSKLQNKPKAIFFEIGFDQATAVQTLAEKFLNPLKIEVFKDFNNLDRVIKIEL